jgi:hypothetical protein
MAKGIDAAQDPELFELSRDVQPERDDGQWRP